MNFYSADFWSSTSERLQMKIWLKILNSSSQMLEWWQNYCACSKREYPSRNSLDSLAQGGGCQHCYTSFSSWLDRFSMEPKFLTPHLWLNPLVSTFFSLSTTPLSDSMLNFSTIESIESVSDPLEGLNLALPRELWDTLLDKLPGAVALSKKDDGIPDSSACQSIIKTKTIKKQ